jgi:hypothetical protein
LPAKILAIGLVVEDRSGIDVRDAVGGSLNALPALPGIKVGTGPSDKGFDGDGICLLDTRSDGVRTKILTIGLVVEVRSGIKVGDAVRGSFGALPALPGIRVGTGPSDKGFDGDGICLLDTRSVGVRQT